MKNHDQNLTENLFDQLQESFEPDDAAATGHVFTAVEGNARDWKGTWTQVSGGRYEINLRKANGQTFTAKVDIVYGYARTIDGIVRSIEGTRSESSDGNDGKYYLVWDPKAPRPLRVWYGRFKGTRFGEGAVGLTE
ncbi:hypothetical protein [Sorangium sp. So ce861]|uniref:hypothetical protein n=1 Tax=Sorangium sp. So ce861 TaxID=3133323 RepID=UPI003F5FD2B6